MRHRPAQAPADPDGCEQNGNEHDVHERAGRQAPERRPGPLRRDDVRDSPERPEDDALGGAAHLAARERVAELVQRHDPEQRQVLEHVEERRGVLARPHLQLEERDHEPGPVQEDVDPGEAEEADSSLLARHSRTSGITA